MPSRALSGALLCLLSSAGFATLSILAKLGFAAGMRLPVMLGLRFGAAAAILLAYLALRRSRVWLGAPRSVQLLALGGIGYAGQATLYFTGLERAPASLSSVLLYVYPAFVAVIGWAVERRRPQLSTGLALVIALTGVTLTAGDLGWGQAGQVDPAGVAFVLASAASYAVYIVVSHRLVPQGGALVSTFWISAGAAFSFGLAALAGSSSGTPLTPGAIRLVAAMSVFSTVLPLTTFLAGMARVGPTAAALLSTLEPVFTVALAAAVLDEALTPRQLLGVALVLGAIVLLQVYESRLPE
ncbi:MAG: DMT family transporter [Anaerolineales bacterium]